MLAGVGGRTIEEAKEALSFEEAMDWFAFRRKFGPLWSIRRLEWAIAQLTSVSATVSGAKKPGGGKFSANDFLPQYGQTEPEPEKAATLQDVFALMKGAKR